MEKINNSKPIEEIYYNKIETVKKKIVLTETGFDEFKHLERLYINQYEPNKNCPHFTIDENGCIFQHFDSNYYTNIIENEEINKHSINIAFVNLGWLTYMIGKDTPINWCGIEVNDTEKVIELPTDYRNCTYFYKFTKKQIKSGAELCNYLLDKHNIKKEYIDNPFLIDGGNPLEYEGICGRSNLSILYKDVNPSFDFKNFSKLLIK